MEKGKKRNNTGNGVVNFGFVPILSFSLVTSWSEGCDECQSVTVFVFKISVT